MLKELITHHGHQDKLLMAFIKFYSKLPHTRITHTLTKYKTHTKYIRDAYISSINQDEMRRWDKQSKQN